ncbi:GNAT family N-acetyltransferase [Desertibacillus haloalkaliphilus]|uniref:GNAT family N-acetyltransferase n=1 Tax=Desertibacillus haloalkaliphilus TaxID=1328930 RepID=UPI001C25DB69|nr:GNAT family N-acetyltransferase [Desertibacillus haloalkaliphilus]MBU8906885.1 GNAT family N-acetyltransferase [Desertibacillus haloalkaliphilus]
MDIITVENQTQLKDAFAIRTEVFVHEQKVPEEEEIDQYEDDAIHFVIYDGDKPVGAGRLRTVEDYGKVERICIKKDYRKSGAGKLLMDKIEKTAEENQLPVLKLNAQTQAEGFYQKLGYQTYSGEFLDAGIPHVAMKKNIKN